MTKTLRQNRKAFQFKSNGYDVIKPFLLSERNYAIRMTSLSRQLKKIDIGSILASSIAIVTSIKITFGSLCGTRLPEINIKVETFQDDLTSIKFQFGRKS